LIQNSSATIHIDFSRCPSVNFNRAYLASVFLNLLTNSIKYAKPNHTPVISIYSKKENGFNQVVFADEGQGFDMDNVKDKIFGFNQKFNDNTDSKGIGLYLVHNHIVSLGGRIDIKSELNEGASFTISFKQ
jgi:signal transduction histidine kinase